MDNESIGQELISVGDAIREVRAQLEKVGLDTAKRIALSMAERAELAEHECDKVKTENLTLKNRLELAKRNVISALKFLSGNP